MKNTRFTLCNGLKQAKDWNTSITLSETEVKESLLWLKSQIPDNGYEQDSVVEKNVLDDRSVNCFKFAFRHIRENRYGHALHEIHDYIYGYGQNLDTSMTSHEWKGLSYLVESGLLSLEMKLFLS